jgi:hypothetical protein
LADKGVSRGGNVAMWHLILAQWHLTLKCHSAPYLLYEMQISDWLLQGQCIRWQRCTARGRILAMWHLNLAQWHLTLKCPSLCTSETNADFWLVVQIMYLVTKLYRVSKSWCCDLWPWPSDLWPW